MSYFTIHKIKIINQYNTKKNVKTLLDIIKKISGYDGFDIIGSTITDIRYNGHKWYECEHDMKAATRFLPGYEIRVKGKGDNGETWEYQFKNGFGYRNDYTEFSDPEDELSDFNEENEKKKNNSSEDEDYYDYYY